MFPAYQGSCSYGWQHELRHPRIISLLDVSEALQALLDAGERWRQSLLCAFPGKRTAYHARFEVCREPTTCQGCVWGVKRVLVFGVRACLSGKLYQHCHFTNAGVDTSASAKQATP